MTRLPGPSFPLDEATFCGSCLVVFSSEEPACPKCAAEIGLWRLFQTGNEYDDLWRSVKRAHKAIEQEKVGGPVLAPAPKSAGRDADAIIPRKGSDV